MKYINVLPAAAIVAALSCVTTSPAQAAPATLPESNVLFLLGQKSLDSGDWKPVESQVEWGVVADLGRKDSVANLVISYLSSKDDSERDGIKYSGDTQEIGLGIRKPFRINPGVAPFVELGAAYVDATLESRGPSAQSSSDSAFGLWAGAGANFAVGEILVVGIDVRYTSASVTLLGKDREAGGLHFGIMAGIGF
jgi:opacity protein-like surface antigen